MKAVGEALKNPAGKEEIAPAFLAEFLIILLLGQRTRRILFSLYRAIKGKETGKPKLSPAGECLPIRKPFRSSLFRGGTKQNSP